MGWNHSKQHSSKTYRDAYYQKEQADSQEANNVTELILEKNRHGSLGTVKLYFHKEYTKFSSVEG